LRLVGFFIDDDKSPTVAFVDGTRPGENAHNLKSVELDVTMVSLVDVVGCYGVAIAMSRRCVELAGTAVGTVAVDEFRGLELPLYHFRSSQLQSAMPDIAFGRILLVKGPCPDCGHPSRANLKHGMGAE
jgi:hypothetical protein